MIEGGEIGEHKGINAPGVRLPASAITPKDADDLRFGLSLGVDMIALSFVQTAEDVRQARQLCYRRRRRRHSDRREARAARGARAPRRNSRGVGRRDGRPRRPRARDAARAGPARAEDHHAARAAHGIPVIVATQVLESMTVEPRPTRAEVNDAASAVADGVDAIMLAGETAMGRFPARAVQTLDAIIRDAETTPNGVASSPPARLSIPSARAAKRSRARALRGRRHARQPGRCAGDSGRDARRRHRAAPVGAAAARPDLRDHRSDRDGAAAGALLGRGADLYRDRRDMSKPPGR